MIEEAITREESFSVMYTPFATKAKADKIDKMKEAFAKKHPDYVAYIYTGKSGFHIFKRHWTSLDCVDCVFIADIEFDLWVVGAGSRKFLLSHGVKFTPEQRANI